MCYIKQWLFNNNLRKPVHLYALGSYLKTLSSLYDKNFMQKSLKIKSLILVQKIPIFDHCATHH